jgi:polar amino acid transport system substrate-binding protein
MGSVALAGNLWWPARAQAADLTAYAEDSPPYHYLKNGVATGLATELLQAGCAKAAISCEVVILPWARAHAFASTRPNTILFSLVRRPDRERDFLWLSPIMTETVWAFGRRDSPPVTRIADLKLHRTGVINGGSAARFLRDAGVPEAAMDRANSIEANLLKLGAGRIDFIVDTEARLDAEKAKFNIQFETIKVLQLHEVTTWFAINHQSSSELIRALRSALEANNNSGVREQILQKYRSNAKARDRGT